MKFLVLIFAIFFSFGAHALDKVSDHIYRGEQPREFLDALNEAKVKKILTLQSGWHDLRDGDLYDLNRKAALKGLQVINLPLSDFRHPSKEDTLFAVNLLKTAVETKEGIYVHCYHGVDRTGWVIAAHRVLNEGVPIDLAVKEWHAKGFHSKWYFWWEKSFRNMIEEIQSERK